MRAFAPIQLDKWGGVPMLTLYFSPGACSLASHIGLEETGTPYEAKPILLAKQQQRTEAYLKINPRGKVPALDANGKILVENTAILTYLARRFPEKRLMPTDPAEEARGIGTMCWFSSIVHPRTSAPIGPNVLPKAKRRKPRSRKRESNRSGPIARKSTPCSREKTGSWAVSTRSSILMRWFSTAGAYAADFP